MEGFISLGLSEETLEAISKKGYQQPSPIQEKCIPLLLHGDKDVVGQAQTGSGKTAAFGIPIIEKFQPGLRKVQAIVLTPTRELAMQVAEEIRSLKGTKKIWISTVYGGAPIGRQMTELEKGADLVVGTPGRVIDLINRKKLDLTHIRFAVLDEADEMLNMGFIEDVETILKDTPKEKRMLMFSATMPDRILQLARNYMKEFELVKIKKPELTADSITQEYFEIPPIDKFDTLCRVLDMEEDFYGIIFCNTKAEVVEIANRLNEKNYNADALHGDIEQRIREQVIGKFKMGKSGVLVATDVAARGIDIRDLTHVINYGLPQDPDSYVHRIGRTGRAGKTGKAVSIITSAEKRKLQFITRMTKAPISKAKVPDALEMIRMKKQRIAEHIQHIFDRESFDQYLDFATELLEKGGAAEVLASALKYTLKGELEPTAYRKIRETEGKHREEKVRLFLAKGRVDRYTPRKLVDFIYEETGIEGRKIQDIKIFENFSFFTAPFVEAELILEIFKKNKGARKSLVERAKAHS